MNQKNTSRHDAIVIGAGLAGGLAAIELARVGKDVLLLEREAAAHHKVCGEFLSFEAQSHLAHLGVDLAAMGAVPIDKLRIIKGRRQVQRRLPFRGMSLSRFVLDEELLRLANAAGVTVKRGATANGLNHFETGWQAEVSQRGGQHTTFEAPTVFLATGKHDLRGQSRPPGTQNNLIGFKMHFETPLTQWDDTVDLVMFQGGYAGVSKIEGGKINISLVVDKERYAELGKDWNILLQTIKQETPALRKRLEGATPCWPKPMAIFGIPYGFVQETSSEPGLYRLGDQVAVIPSFSGNGMSIALFSAALAVRDYLEKGNSYNQQIGKALKRKLFYATLLSQAGVHPFWSRQLFALLKRMPWLITRFAMRTRLEN